MTVSPLRDAARARGMPTYPSPITARSLRGALLTIRLPAQLGTLLTPVHGEVGAAVEPTRPPRGLDDDGHEAAAHRCREEAKCDVDETSGPNVTPGRPHDAGDGAN